MSTASSTAKRGTRQRSMMACLWCVFSLVITAAIVVSEPEPAVVGTAMNGGRACMTLKSPVICSTVQLGRTMRAAAALAVSIGEPPPTARKPSQPSARYRSRTCSMMEIVGLARTPSKWTAEMPAASICARIGGTSAARWRHWKKYMYSTYILPGWEERKRFADTMFDVELVYCPEGLANVYAETECANCKLETYMGVETEYRFPVAWMKLWQRHRNAEALTAPNARKLAAALIAEGKRSLVYNKNWSERTDVLHGVDWKRKKPHELLRLTKEELTYFNGAEDALKRLKALLLARKYGVACRLGEEVTKVTEGQQEDFLKRGVLPGKAERYLDRQAARYKSRLWPGYLLDYWTMAERLGENLTERDVMWPQNLKRAHDQMQERQKAEAAEKRREAFQQRYERMKKYAFTDGDILIRPCGTEEELIAEGKALHHCVASYAERHARGELTIFFIRRKDKPDEPWYTLNFNEKKLSVTENRGMCNCARTEEIQNFENTWLEWIRSGRKRRTSAA